MALEPITRQEQIIAGKNLEPITRMERFLKEYGGGSGGGTGGSVQPDWNQTDETAADFIKNKPFGDMLVEVMPETEVVGEDDGGGGFMTTLDSDLLQPTIKSMSIVYDGTKYICDRQTIGAYAFLYGNSAAMGGVDTGEPFSIAFVISEGIWVILLPDAEPHNISIASIETQQLESRYYNRHNSFYVYSDEYLYVDAEITTKATANDIRVAARSGPIVVYAGHSGDVIFAYTATYVGLDFGDYAVVGVSGFNEDDKEPYHRMYYTAEYVPEG